MKSYHPPKLPIKLNFAYFAKELGEASFELGKLDGRQRDLPNASLLISPLSAKEATVSSKIEGTKSTVSDVFLYESGEVAKYPDTVEVFNYRMATLWATKNLKNRKFNLAFIKELHSNLLKNTRGEQKRGEFRKEQVFIGTKGATIEQASYIPPEPFLVLDYMENLEKYILSNQENYLIKAAIIHYQFEAIHPFFDGNGRIGRLIIPLLLYQKDLLYQPILYLSGYFNKHRDRYIDTLHLVDINKNYDEWVKFFLISVKEQAKETQSLIQRMWDLFQVVNQKTEVIKSPYIAKTINFIFKKPIFTAKELNSELKADRATVSRLTKRLIQLQVISSLFPKRKKALFLFRDLFKLL